MLVGVTLLETLQPLFEMEEETTKNDEFPITAKELFDTFLLLYKEIMSIIYAPMMIQERLVAEAKDFYLQIKEEFGWSDAVYQKRVLEITEEISLRGTYTQTSAELEMGARIAWHNLAKCIGRISWNTLQVRDCRNVYKPQGMFTEVEEHLRIATAGTNIQSVMTVFPARSKSETLGPRFWSAQYVRYAGCTQQADDENGHETVLGDPANVDLTDYLLENDYWTPPEPRSAFDVLPLVIKMPG